MSKELSSSYCSLCYFVNFPHETMTLRTGNPNKAIICICKSNVCLKYDGTESERFDSFCRRWFNGLKIGCHCMLRENFTSRIGLTAYDLAVTSSVITLNRIIVTTQNADNPVPSIILWIIWRQWRVIYNNISN